MTLDRRKKIRSSRSITICLLLLFSTSISAAPPPKVLTISSLPFDGPTAQMRVFEELAPLLQAVLNQRVRFVPGESYEQVIEGLGTNKIDLAFLGAAAYIQARKLGYARAVVRAVREHKQFYYGVILTRRTGPFQKIADLKGKRVAFVDRRSTSGYFYPRLLFKNAGLDPDHDITPVFAGSHSSVARLVGAGKVEAGACFEGAEKILMDPTQVMAIATTKAIPGDPIVVRPGLGIELVTKLRAAFLQLSELPEARTFFELSAMDGFVPAIDSDYDEIAELVDAL